MNRVKIFSQNNDLVISETPKNLVRAFELFTQISDDFFPEGRKYLPPQERDFFKLDNQVT